MPIRTFLDSNVLMAAIRGDHTCHVSARGIIDDPDRLFLLSDMVRLEVLPKAIYFKNKAEADFYEDVFAAASEVAVTSHDSIERATELAKQFGLGPFDACLAEGAISLAADEFVTAERPEKAFFRINGCATKFTSIA